MSTAATVPETYGLEGDDAVETLRSTGRSRLFVRTLGRFRAADGFSHARALAFQFTLTALPALIAAVGLATVLDQGGLRKTLEQTLLGIAPGPSGQILSQAFQQGRGVGPGSGTSALVIGLVAAVISGTSAMAVMERGANRIYGLNEDRPTPRRYARAFVLATTAGVLLFLSFVLLVAGSVIAKAARTGAGWSDGLVTAWNWARWPVGVLLVVAAVALLFRLSPARRQPAASWLAAGSVVAVALWSGFTALLALYLSASAGFGQTYGPLAGVIGILLWAYLSSIALLIGVAFAAQLEAARAEGRSASSLA